MSEPRATPLPTATELKLHPEFYAALQCEIDGALQLFDRNAAFDNSVMDIGAFMLGALALGLHFDGGLSHRRLRTLGGQGGLVSAGRATGILWRFVHAGLIKPAGPTVRGKRLFYLPEPSALEGYRRRLDISLACVSKLDPVCARYAAEFHRDDHFVALIVGLSRGLTELLKSPHRTILPFEAVAHRTKAILIVFELLHETGSTLPDVTGGTTEISFRELAARFDVSRTHVRQVVNALLARDYLEHRTEGRSAFTGSFLTDFGDYYAAGWEALIATVHEASERLT